MDFGQILIIAAIAGVAAIILSLREYRRGRKSVYVTTVSVLEFVAYTSVAVAGIYFDRCLAREQYAQAFGYMKAQTTIMLLWMAVWLAASAARFFFDPDAHREADDMVKRYKENQHDQ